MPPTRDDLLASIRANPEDDAPRFALADWLDANGDPARAEFVRVEIEREGLEPYTPRWNELHERSRILRKSLAIDARDILSSTRRGFHSSIQAGFAALADGIETIGPWSVALTVLLGRDYGSREDAEKLRGGADWRLEAATRLFASSWVREWRSLEVQHLPGDAALIDAMFGPGNLAGLTGLGFVGVLDDEAFAAVLRCDLPALTTFAIMEVPMLDEQRLTRASLVALMESMLLERLRALQLHGPWFDDEGLRMLVDSSRIANLAGLHLPDGASPAGQAAILASPNLANLRELDLGWRPLDEISAATLGRRDVLPSLERLGVGSVPPECLPALRDRLGDGLVLMNDEAAS